MSSPERVAESFDVEAYENIRMKLQMPGEDRQTVQRELAAFCSQRIGQMVTISGRAEIFKDRRTGEFESYEEPLLITDEKVVIADATEHGLIVGRELDEDRQPALEWYSADTFPVSADAT